MSFFNLSRAFISSAMSSEYLLQKPPHEKHVASLHNPTHLIRGCMENGIFLLSYLRVNLVSLSKKKSIKKMNLVTCVLRDYARGVLFLAFTSLI